MRKYEKPRLIKSLVASWNLEDFKTFLGTLNWLQKCADGLEEFERNRMGRKYEI